jgi:hypothetical protein
MKCHPHSPNGRALRKRAPGPLGANSCWSFEPRGSSLDPNATRKEAFQLIERLAHDNRSSASLQCEAGFIAVRAGKLTQARSLLEGGLQRGQKGNERWDCADVPVSVSESPAYHHLGLDPPPDDRDTWAWTVHWNVSADGVFTFTPRSTSRGAKPPVAGSMTFADLRKLPGSWMSPRQNAASQRHHNDSNHHRGDQIPRRARARS